MNTRLMLFEWIVECSDSFYISSHCTSRWAIIKWLVKLWSWRLSFKEKRLEKSCIHQKYPEGHHKSKLVKTFQIQMNHFSSKNDHEEKSENLPGSCVYMKNLSPGEVFFPATVKAVVCLFQTLGVCPKLYICKYSLSHDDHWQQKAAGKKRIFSRNAQGFVTLFSSTLQKSSVTGAPNRPSDARLLSLYTNVLMLKDCTLWGKYQYF